MVFRNKWNWSTLLKNNYVYSSYTWSWCITRSQQKSVFPHVFSFLLSPETVQYEIFELFFRVSVRYPGYNKLSISVLPTYNSTKCYFKVVAKTETMKSNNITSLQSILPTKILYTFSDQFYVKKRSHPVDIWKCHFMYIICSSMCLLFSEISFTPSTIYFYSFNVVSPGFHFIA